MADNDELELPEETGENTMLRKAIEAMRLGDRAQARDLLTRLLKADQTNIAYWIWLSAVVDSSKGRLYCLQSALQMDPQNAAAKRGLILLGALPPDDSVPPFPVNRPRLWDDKLNIPQEPQEKMHGWANPVTRIFIILGVTILVLGLFVGGYMFLPESATPAYLRPFARRPTITLSFTPTVTPVFRTATPTYLGATPLAHFLSSTYTPTALYVVTEHPVLTTSSFKAGLRFFGIGDYRTARIQFQDVLKNEPNAVDAYYYIGETYRAEGDYNNARDAYQTAININSNFAPAYLGRARAYLGLDPSADVASDLDSAVALDRLFAEAYIERGKFRVNRDSYGAISDIETALEITPDSALAYLYLSKAQLALGQNDAALESALRANQIDMTLVPAYLAMARAYIATGQSEKAVGVMQTYTIYAPEDINALVALATAYNAAGDYQMAIGACNKVIQNDVHNAEAYYQRGYAYLSMENNLLAEADFKNANTYDPNDFDAYIGLGRAYNQRGLPGDAYMVVQKNAESLAKTDVTKAQVYYWEAIFLEQLPDPNDQAGARSSWYRLTTLPAEAMPEEWRNQAFQRLNITPTSTPSLVPTKIPSNTPTPGP